jgi:hypothetical protein
VALGSAPRLVILRERLAAERDSGAPFSEAWERAEAEALAGLPGHELHTWIRALATTRWAWRAAYEGRSSRVAWAMAELEAFSSDGELEPLAHSPVA